MRVGKSTLPTFLAVCLLGTSAVAWGRVADDGASCCSEAFSSTRLGAVSRHDTDSSDGTVQVVSDEAKNSVSSDNAPESMVLIPSGMFIMGGVGPEARRDEFPRHRVFVDCFWMDRTEVTNAQFKRFVDDTGYETTAERHVDWELLKKNLPEDAQRPSDEKLAPGSLTFTKPTKQVRHYSQWWKWTPGACWKHPDGPGSSLEGRDEHPVVHVSYEDAQAYARWAGKRLPTEAEWEYAARGGLEGQPYVWGADAITSRMANVWQGRFPTYNSWADGYEATAPVATYPVNRFGLYDMAGNVWEWCSDKYHPRAYLIRVLKEGRDAIYRNPKGPETSFDPRRPFAKCLRVVRGGSFLCHESYCSSYRPSARMSCSPDTGMAHTGFRCAKDYAVKQDATVIGED